MAGRHRPNEVAMLTCPGLETPRVPMLATVEPVCPAKRAIGAIRAFVLG
jgi:hypothetical protein